jgi:HNH endonuclease
MDNLQSRFHELFAYVDGNLVRKVSVGSAKAGSFADYKESNGYLRVRVDGVRYGVHQIVFCMQNGYIPNMIDHINGIKTDNRIENLRIANYSQNGYNKPLGKTCKSGVKNVKWVLHMKKWQVRLRVEKTPKIVGYFDNLELAELVAIEARDKFHGAYANHKIKELA